MTRGGRKVAEREDGPGGVARGGATHMARYGSCHISISESISPKLLFAISAYSRLISFTLNCCIEYFEEASLKAECFYLNVLGVLNS